MEEILLEHFANYPNMQLEDFIKLIYQNEFGCGHFLTDEKRSLEFLEMELSSDLSTTENKLFENIGNGFQRMNLSNSLRDSYDLKILNKLFIMSSYYSEGTEKGFYKKLGSLKNLCESNKIPFTVEDFNNVNKICKPIHHSEIYRNAYNPTYRVIREEYKDYFPILEKINTLIERKEKVCIAIDGKCGAGKTTLANLLALVFNSSIISMDDFFLPKELRKPERYNEAGGNLHYERFLDEVILKLSGTGEVVYRKFDCKEMQFTHNKKVKRSPLIIVEGTYSLRPEFLNAYDIKVFMDIDKDAQIKRIKKRNGEESFKMFAERWIPLEEKYINHFEIENICDFKINNVS